MNTRAKFYCHGVIETELQFEWKLSAVYHNDIPGHENKKFNEASPNGTFEMTVDKSVYKGENPIPGREYYLDISLAPEDKVKEIEA